MRNTNAENIDFDNIVQESMQNIYSEVVEQTTIQNNFMELQQTNIIKFETKVESVAVNLDSIKKIHSICNQIKSSDSSAGEILLGIATLFAGAFFSAIISSVPYILEWKSILFYGISPVVAVSCFIAFLLLRKNREFSNKEFADRILEYLPDDN